MPLTAGASPTAGASAGATPADGADAALAAITFGILDVPTVAELRRCPLLAGISGSKRGKH